MGSMLLLGAHNPAILRVLPHENHLKAGGKPGGFGGTAPGTFDLSITPQMSGIWEVLPGGVPEVVQGCLPADYLR